MTEPQPHIRQWLDALAARVASIAPIADIERKLAPYADDLAYEFNAAVFSQPALRYVAARCKFWPSYGQVVALLTAYRNGPQASEADTKPRPGPARESPIPYHPLPPAPPWCYERGIRGEDRSEPDDPGGLKRIADLVQRAKLVAGPRYLSPEQLDQINPLPNGYKRAGTTK